MENSEDVLKFRSLNMAEYLNSKHPVHEEADINAAKHELSNLLAQVDKSMYNYFLEKSDCLLNLLNIYQRCHTILSNFKDSKLFYENSRDDIEVVRSEDFKKKCRLFAEDMSIFITNERYLLSAEVFNDGTILCVLTNDLLFVGEKVEKDKYSLKRSIHKGSVKMEPRDNTLKLLIDGGFCTLTGKECALEDFYEAFQEVSYEYIPEAGKEESVDREYVDFCIETRKFGDIATYLELSGKRHDCLSDVIDGLDIDDESELQVLMGLHKTPSKFFKQFFLGRFKTGLSDINRIQKLSSFLADAFDFLEVFSKSFVEHCTKYGVGRRMCVLCMEECVLETFSSLENRIFGGGSHSRDAVEEIKSRLEFNNMNFQYLVGRLEERKTSYASRYLDRCKEEIRQKLSVFFE